MHEVETKNLCDCTGTVQVADPETEWKISYVRKTKTQV